MTANISNKEFEYQDGHQGVQVNVLTSAFDNVRKTIFPRWDRQREWIAIHDPELPAHGKCLSKRKIIVVKSILEGDNNLKALLAHEICHSSARGHNKRFFIRLLKAAERAETAGWSGVADLIKEDVRSYNKVQIQSTADVYGRIKECLVDRPDASYESIIGYLAQDYGMFPEEFETAFKNSRSVYDEHQRSWQEIQKVRQASKAKLSVKIEI